MKRYRFPLENVLRIRQTQEELALQELARANYRLRDAMAEHHRQEERYSSLCATGNATDVQGLRRERDERDRQAARMVASRLVAEHAEAEAQHRTREWTAASRRVAALERLDSRRRSEHEVEVLRSATAAVDDLVTARFVATRFDCASGDGDLGEVFSS